MMTTQTKNDTLTAVPGFRVGQYTHVEGATGCTVILCPPNTVGGVDQRGGAPGTRETDLLRPMHLVEHVHAVVLSGGSAYGLATADGVMKWLEKQNIGYPVGEFVVPIVPAAILMDLMIGKAGVRPSAHMGFAACEEASDAPVAQGSVGAGTGCCVGMALGPQFCTKGGIGSASVQLDDGLVVAALVAVNAIGDVIDADGSIIAGTRTPPDGNGFIGTMNVLKQMHAAGMSGSATVIGVVATNARLSKEHVNKMAQMAQDGLARAVNPAHTMLDGDTIFGLASGEVEASINLVGALGADVFAQAIRNGVRAATSLAGVRAPFE